MQWLVRLQCDDTIESKGKEKREADVVGEMKDGRVASPQEIIITAQLLTCVRRRAPN